jgi:hypothetical protein
MPDWTKENFGELRDVSPQDAPMQWRFAREALRSPLLGKSRERPQPAGDGFHFEALRDRGHHRPDIATRAGRTGDLPSATDSSEAGVIRVDRRARIVAGRRGTFALLGGPRLWLRCKARNLELELASVTRRELGRPRLKWLAGNRAHAVSVLPSAERETARSLLARCDCEAPCGLAPLRAAADRATRERVPRRTTGSRAYARSPGRSLAAPAV